MNRLSKSDRTTALLDFIEANLGGLSLYSFRDKDVGLVWTVEVSRPGEAADIFAGDSPHEALRQAIEHYRHFPKG